MFAIIISLLPSMTVNSIPFYVVIGHFTNSWITTVIFLLYFFGLKLFPPTVMPLSIVRIVISVFSIFISFKEFPIWFAIVTTIIAIYFIVDFFVKLMKGLKE